MPYLMFLYLQLIRPKSFHKYIFCILVDIIFLLQSFQIHILQVAYTRSFIYPYYISLNRCRLTEVKNQVELIRILFSFPRNCHHLVIQDKIFHAGLTKYEYVTHALYKCYPLLRELFDQNTLEMSHK